MPPDGNDRPTLAWYVPPRQFRWCLVSSYAGAGFIFLCLFLALLSRILLSLWRFAPANVTPPEFVSWLFIIAFTIASWLAVLGPLIFICFHDWSDGIVRGWCWIIGAWVI